MKKSELKTGMYLEFKNGTKKLVLLNTSQGDVVSNIEAENCNHIADINSPRLYNFYPLNHLSENLEEIGHDHIIGDVVKVYGMYGKLLWGRRDIIQIDWGRLPRLKSSLSGGEVQVTSHKNNFAEVIVVRKGSHLPLKKVFEICKHSWSTSGAQLISYLID